MSRKDYRAIAKLMAEIRTSTPTDTWVKLMLGLCEIFRQDNPRFDKERFKDACYAELSIDDFESMWERRYIG